MMINISKQEIYELQEELESFNVELAEAVDLSGGESKLKSNLVINFNSKQAYHESSECSKQDFFEQFELLLIAVNQELDINIKLDCEPIELKSYYEGLCSILIIFLNRFKTEIVHYEEIDNSSYLRKKKAEILRPDFSIVKDNFKEISTSEYITLDVLFRKLKSITEKFYMKIKEKYSYLSNLENSRKQLSSFRLSNPDRDFGFIYKLFENLKQGGYIDKSIKTESFRTIFRNSTVINKIKWTGYKGDLRTLIKKLYDNHLIATSAKNKWSTTAYCFNLIDDKGKVIEIDHSKIRSWKPTKNDKAVSDLVDISMK